MKTEMVGSFTTPKGNAMPEDCIRCHNAEWGTIVVDSVCVKCLVEDNSALREAGKKMAELLKFLQLQNDAAHLESAGLWSVNGETEAQVTATLAEWEAANK